MRGSSSCVPLIVAAPVSTTVHPKGEAILCEGKFFSCLQEKILRVPGLFYFY